MHRSSRACCGTVAAMIAVALASAMPHVTRAEERSWDDVVKAADAEGEVDVHGGPGEVYHQVLTDGFRKAFPEIKVNFSGLNGRDAIPKIIRERDAGIYNWDVYVGGSSSLLQSLKPIGAFAPLRDAFILPEVLDDKAWFGGMESAWVDKDKTAIFGFEATVTSTMLVNWDVISHDQLKSYDDLLKPEFAGKIVFDDPRFPGPGLGAAQRLYINFGADYMKRLFAEQKIVYIASPRQEAEWVVSGKYPINLGGSSDELRRFQQQGLGRNVSSFNVPIAHPTIDYAYGTVSMISHAPHANAAAVYINWLLSKAGQSDWGKTGGNSRRVDIPPAWPELAPKPGMTYVAEQSEANLPNREEAQALAKQFIPTQP